MKIHMYVYIPQYVQWVNLNLFYDDRHKSYDTISKCSLIFISIIILFSQSRCSTTWIRMKTFFSIKITNAIQLLIPIVLAKIWAQRVGYFDRLNTFTPIFSHTLFVKIINTIF